MNLFKSATAKTKHNPVNTIWPQFRNKERTTVRALLLTGLITVAAQNTVQANQADPTPYIFKQPDGNEFVVSQRGDERGLWFETKEGYTIEKAANNYWYYVRRSENGEVIKTRRKAHLPMLQHEFEMHVNPHLNPNDPPFWWEPEPFDDAGLHKGEHSGNVLILMVEFPDQAMTYPESTWADRIQDSTAGAKTIADYYEQVSYGKARLEPAYESFGVVNDGVIGPIMMNMNHPDTGSQSPLNTYPEHLDIFQHAVDTADDYIDFSLYDTDGNNLIEPTELAIILLVAGHHGQSSLQSPSINAHAHIHDINIVFTDDNDSGGNVIGLAQKYTMIGEMSDDLQQAGASVPSTLGVFVHELGHLIYGLPDLYDINGDVSGSSAGIGAFGLMGSGDKGRDSAVDTQNGQTPALLSAWSQLKLEWVTPNTNFWLTGLTTAGKGNDGTGTPDVGIAHVAVDLGNGLTTCSVEKYFLAQYRTAEGYDRGLSAVNDAYGNEFAGLVIYHINEQRADNNTASAKLVDVEEASILGVDTVAANSFQLWNQDSQTVFDQFSTPDSHYGSGLPSGISITVGNPRLDAQGNNAVNLTIDSLCDVNGLPTNPVLIPGLPQHQVQ